jgi:hypothetical protein
VGVRTLRTYPNSLSFSESSKVVIRSTYAMMAGGEGARRRRTGRAVSRSDRGVRGREMGRRATQTNPWISR